VAEVFAAWYPGSGWYAADGSKLSHRETPLRMGEQMKSTLADPNKKWSGFRSTEYALENLKILALLLTQKRQVGGKSEEIPTTVGEIYKSLAGRSVEVEDVLELEIKTDTEELVFAGPPFTREMLCKLLEFRNDGTDPFSSSWFWYDWDWNTSVQESYSFFVVCGDRIVRECVSFSDFPGSGFDPSLLWAVDESVLSGWSSERARRKAETRFWYRKFYAETRTGLMMVLRKPELSERWNLDTTDRLLRKIHVLLWVLIALVGLVLIRLLK